LGILVRLSPGQTIEGASPGSCFDAKSSWAVPVFVLNSRATHEFGADEDELPPNGNPHPANPHFLNQQNHNGQVHGFFEDVGDLNEV
jgi:hypothetical protein